MEAELARYLLYLVSALTVRADMCGQMLETGTSSSMVGFPLPLSPLQITMRLYTVWRRKSSLMPCLG